MFRASTYTFPRLLRLYIFIAFFLLKFRNWTRHCNEQISIMGEPTLAQLWLESIKCDGLTINCDISFSVKTRLSSSSSFLTLKPQTFEKIAEEIVKWWFYFFTFAMTTASGNRLLSNLNCRSVGRLIISSNEVIKFKILSLNYKINMWSKIEVQWLDCILINPLCK